MKLKMIKAVVEGQEREVALVMDGKPVYVSDAGVDTPVDAPDLIAKFKARSDEWDAAKKRAESAEAALESFKGEDGAQLDADTVKRALAIVSGLDTGKLVDAEKIAKLREEAQEPLKKQIAQLQADSEARERALTAKLHGERITNFFANSQFAKSRLAHPAAILQPYFGKHFDFVEDTLVVKGADGKPLASKKPERIGELADGEEGLQILVDSDANKDHWYKGTRSTGSGEGAPNRVNGNATTRAEFRALPPAKQAELMAQGVQLTD